MAKSHKRVLESVQPAPVVVAEAPATEQPTTPKAKIARYGWPTGKPSASQVISMVSPAPYVKRGKSLTRFNALYNVPEQTVADYLAKAQAAGIKSTLALADLRWDYLHGFFTVDGVKFEAPKAE
jgi:hypothetical protein